MQLPTTDQIYVAIKASDYEGGVFLVIKNYSDDEFYGDEMTDKEVRIYDVTVVEDAYVMALLFILENQLTKLKIKKQRVNLETN